MIAFFKDIFDSMAYARIMLIEGILNTIKVAVLTIIIGTIIGILMGLILCYGNKYLRALVRLYIDIMRGIPILVTVFIAYYIVGFALQGIMGITISQMTSGVIALAALASAQIAELTRGALQSIPKGQSEAGMAIGLTFWQVFLSVLFPQAIIQIIPPWINTATEMIKGSTLLSLIGVTELLLIGQRIVALRGRALIYYIFIGAVFFIINTAIQYGGTCIEKKLNFQKK